MKCMRKYSFELVEGGLCSWVSGKGFMLSYVKGLKASENVQDEKRSMKELMLCMMKKERIAVEQ